MRSSSFSIKSSDVVILLAVVLALNLASVADEAIAQQSAGLANESFVLELGGKSFDPLDPNSTSLFANHVPNSKGDFHLVQFEGPMQTSWFQSMRSHGLEVVQYIHPYTYIVWADATEIALARSMAGVRWAGPFLPEFRVIPQQRSLSSTREPTNILVSRHADLRALQADLASHGVKVLNSRPYLGHFSLLETSVPGDRYMDLGRTAAVYTVQQAVPMTLRGEMSNQAIVDLSFSSNQEATPGYNTWLGATGYDGSGVTVSIIDSGIRESHVDLEANMVACVSQGSPTSCTTSNSNHGTHVAGAVAGNASSGITDSGGFLRGQGVAPGASLVQQRYNSPGLTYNFGSACDDPDNYCLTPSGMLVLFKEAALSGATHANNSWGSSTIKIGYDLASQQVDVMTRDANPDLPGQQPVLPVWSIMNGNGDSPGGPCPDASLGAPDEAKNLFAVGSTELIPGTYPGGTVVPNPSGFFNLSGNSAHGPACDGRVGVHIVAPGCGTDSPTAASNTSFAAFCGTSMASPVASGALAVFIERYRDLFGGATPSPALMKAAFMAVAANMHGQLNADGQEITETPSRFQGYGRLDLDSAVNPPSNVMYFDQETVFTATGQQWTLPLVATDPTEPVRIMMVFTDAFGHGLGGTTPAWVNDLNLRVAVGGDLYLGNQIGADGFSQTGGSPDGMNNMEAVFLRPDQHNGDVFDVSVHAANIVADALNPHAPEDPAQDFALVCYNCDFGEPTFSIELNPDFIGACVPDEGGESQDVIIDLGALGTYAGTVDLSASGAPVGVSTSIDPLSVEVPGSAVFTVNVDSVANAGNSVILISGDDGEDVREQELALRLDQALLSGPVLNSPVDGAQDVTLTPAFDWDGLPDVENYQFQVATDADFSDLVYDEVLVGANFVIPDDLATGTEYFWRVAGINLCGEGLASDVFSFTTRFEPAAEWSPSSFDFEVASGASISGALVISNAGTGNLTFDVVTDTIGDRLSAGRDFSGSFDPSNWELVNSPENTGGFVTVEDGPPVEVFITGGDDAVAGDTDWQIEIPLDGTISFAWGYQSSDIGTFDTGGYAINGSYTQLAANNAQVPFFDQTASVDVSAGDLFAFRVNTTDGLFDPGVFGATSFEFTPTVCGGDLTPVPWLSVSPVSGSVPAGDDETVTVSVDATGLAPGSYEGWLCINTNDTATELAVVPVSLMVFEPDPGVLEVAPTLLPFGAIEVGDDDSLSFTVSNVASPGSDGFVVHTIGLSGDPEFAITGGDCDAGMISLAPGDSCTVEVTFTPSADDSYAGSILVEANGQSDTVVLTGEGELPSSELAVSPTLLEFGLIGVGDDDTLAFTVSNVAPLGSDSLVVETITRSGDDEFEITGGTCDPGVTSLAPNDSCTVEVSFTPVDNGSYDGSILVEASNGESDTVALEGEGQLAGVLEVDPVFVDFEEVAVGSDRALSLLVLNSADFGSADVEIKAIDLTGDAEFEVTGGTCEAEATVLAPSDSCTVELSFKPSDEDSYTATLAVLPAVGDSETVELRGEGIVLPDDVFADRFED